MLNLFCCANVNLEQYKDYQDFQRYYIVTKHDGSKEVVLKNGTVLENKGNMEITSELLECSFVKIGNTRYYIDGNYNAYKIELSRNISSGEFIIKTNGKFGIVPLYMAHSFILPPVYDDIEYMDGGYAKVKQNGKYAYFDTKNNTLSEFKYNDLTVVKKGLYSSTPGLLHYYIKEKTRLGWRYISSDAYKEAPKRFVENVSYYMLFGFLWDGLP